MVPVNLFLGRTLKNLRSNIDLFYQQLRHKFSHGNLLRFLDKRHTAEASRVILWLAFYKADIKINMFKFCRRKTSKSASLTWLFVNRKFRPLTTEINKRFLTKGYNSSFTRTCYSMNKYKLSKKLALEIGSIHDFSFKIK